MKYFNFIRLIFLSIFYYCTVIVAQQQNSYIQIDTVKIIESTKSMPLIFKVDTSEITFNYDSYIITSMEIYNVSDGLMAQKLIDTSMNFYNYWIDYVDLNLDGFLDLDIHLGDYNLIEHHSIWLYNKLQNQYYHSKDYSMLSDYYIDYDKKEIESVRQFLGGRGGVISTYKIDDENLYLIKDVLIDTDSTTKVYIDLYENIFDSLLIIEKKWLIEVEEIPKEMRTSDIYYYEGGRNMQYLKKELYKYQKINDEIIKEVQKYQVVNNNWQVVKD